MGINRYMLFLRNEHNGHRHRKNVFNSNLTILSDSIGMRLYIVGGLGEVRTILSSDWIRSVI